MTQISKETFQNSPDPIQANENEPQKILKLLDVDVLHRGSISKIIDLLRKEPVLLESIKPDQKKNLDIDNALLSKIHLQVQGQIESLSGVDKFTGQQRQEVLLALGRYAYAYNKYHIKWARPDRTIDIPSPILSLVTKDHLQSEFNKDQYIKYHGLHGAMSINEDMIPDWENALSHLLLGPELVVSTKDKQATEWRNEFDVLIAKRGRAAKILQEVIEKSKSGEQVNQKIQDEIFRELAEYLNLLNQYHVKWKANYRYVELPEFLAEKVELNARQNTAVATSARIMDYQHHLTENDDRADRLSDTAKNLLIRMVGKNLRLKYCIIPCLDNGKPKKEDQAYISVIEGIGYEPTQENIKALKLIVAYISEHLKSIDDCVKNQGLADRGEVRLYQALEQSSFLPGVQDITDGLSKVIADKSTEFIKEGKIIKLTPGQVPDLSQIKTGFSVDSIPPALREQIESEILREVAQKEEFKDLSESELRNHLSKALEYLYGKERDIPLKNRKVNYGELEKVEQEIVEIMVRKVANDTTVSALRASLFIDADTDDQWQLQAIKAFEEMLDPNEGSLKNMDIANLYYLLRLSQESSSKPGPNLMLAMESLSLLRQDHRNKKTVINLESQLFNRVVSIFIDVAKDKGAESFTEAMKKINIPPEHQTTVRNVGETIRLKTADAIQEAIDRSLAEARNFPIFWIAGIITGTAAVGIPVGIKVRRVTYQLNAGRLHKFYTDSIESTDDLIKFRRAFKLSESITIEQIRSARIEAKNIYGEITDLQSRFYIFERSRLNKSGNALISSMETSEFERYGKQIRKQFSKSPENAARILSSFESDPAKLQEILVKSGYTAEQAKEGVRFLQSEALKIESAEDLMRKFDDLYQQLDDIENMPDPAARKTARDAFRKKVETYMAELGTFEKAEGSAGLRRDLSQRLLAKVAGDNIEMTDELWEAILKAHASDSLIEKTAVLKNACDKIGGLSDVQKTAVVRRFIRLGITGEIPSALRSSVNSIEQARLLLEYIEPDQVVQFLRELPKKLPSLHPSEFTDLIQKAKQCFAGTADVISDINRVERACKLALDSLEIGNISRAGARIAGKALLVFGVLLDGYFLNVTYQELEDAKKNGRKNQEEILRDKLFSQISEVGAATFGVPAAFAAGGPIGWALLGGLFVKGAASNYLYDYALANDTDNYQVFRSMKAQDLMAVMKGKMDWKVENMPDWFVKRLPEILTPVENGKGSIEYRRAAALYAYLYNNKAVSFTSEDEAYLRTICRDEKKIDEQRMLVLRDKIGQFYTDMQSFLERNKDILSKFSISERLEYAQSFAELKHLQRRAHELENLEIFESELEKLKAINPRLKSDLMLDTSAEADESMFAYLDAFNNDKLQSLYYPYLMQMVLEKNGESKRDQFILQVMDTVFLHDYADYLSDVSSASDSFAEYRRNKTFGEILYFEINKLFVSPKTLEEFVAFMQDLRAKLRKFMDEDKTLDPHRERPAFGRADLNWEREGRKRD
ncbi:TPA: hypothetical protein HA238_04095 [Candidatus Micrarchaeota archaeon]|nr:hypothetical protein [Candidatus Micrarchaeota archaeon]